MLFNRDLPSRCHKTSLSERSSLPSKNFLCISMDMLQIGPLVLVRRLVEAPGFPAPQLYLLSHTLTPKQESIP